MLLVEVGFLTGLRASNPIDIRWGDKEGKDGTFQGENGSYQEMLVPGGGVEPPWAEARGILRPPSRDPVDSLQEPICWD